MKVFFRSFVLGLFAILYLIPFQLSAEEICIAPHNSRDIIRCALKRHPDVQKQTWNLEKNPAQKEKAAQRPNPILAFDMALGPQNADSKLESELFLSYPFELGKKRQARINKVDSQAHLEETKLRQTQEKIVMETLWRLHRLRQIQKESFDLKESIQSFHAVQGEYSSRSYLSPEQETVLNIFQLAVQDYALRQNKLENEQRKILQYLKLATQLGDEQILKNLPSLPISWPLLDVMSQNKSSQTDSIEEKKTQAEWLVAQSQKELARSEAWSDLQIGPLVQYEKGQENAWRYGLGLQVGLPLMNRNQGGKALADLNQNISKSKLALEQKNAFFKKAELMKQYKLLTQTLKQSRHLTKFKDRHPQIHRSFQQGLIDPQLVIESHRQIVELTSHLHELEQEALLSLWSLRALEGKLLEETSW